MAESSAGHIIVKPGDSMQRAIRDATVAVVEHDQAANAPRALPVMGDDGLYQVDKPDTRKLRPRELRALAESYGVQGVKVNVAIDDDKARVTFAHNNGWTQKEKALTFDAGCPPTIGQAKAMLNALGNQVRA